ncbi:Chitinase A1 precursor [Botrimarina mediterranea]|uniref:chitinase n=2 Tax=Botrimarina mediterranea TaxID=2528022 RepID=A0A518KA93_9BACT|nr:Chitinase A1 precursor [Botrimarina mediterranea]
MTPLSVTQAAEPATKPASDVPASDVPSPDVFVGYVHGQARDLNYSLYTHLCHAFVVAGEDGKLRPNKSVPDAAFAAKAHRHGVRVLLSLGGWGWDAQFAAIVLDREAETHFVQSVLQLVDDADYDGIDLDWEYPDSREEVPGFERLTRRLRAGLDAIAERKGRPMQLTMASAAHPQTLEWLSNEFLLETMDWVNVMTYDYAGGWAGFAGHNAPFTPSSKTPADKRHSVTTTFEYLLEKRGLPPERLALGLPLYGRAFSVPQPYADTTDTDDPGRSKTYLQSQELIAQGWTRTWDDETQTPWLTSPARHAVISYDDAESIRLKTRWARDRGLRGVFFWEVSQDRLPGGGNPLQEAARSVWGAFDVTGPR